MKFKTTKKNMKSYDFIISTGADDLQHLLKFQEPIAYSTRIEGWACDYYDIGGILISTGYAPIDSKNTYSSYTIRHEYEEKARAITSNNEINYEDKEKAVNELLKDFIDKVTTKPKKEV